MFGDAGREIDRVLFRRQEYFYSSKTGAFRQRKNVGGFVGVVIRKRCLKNAATAESMERRPKAGRVCQAAKCGNAAAGMVAWLASFGGVDGDPGLWNDV